MSEFTNQLHQQSSQSEVSEQDFEAYSSLFQETQSEQELSELTAEIENDSKAK